MNNPFLFKSLLVLSLLSLLLSSVSALDLIFEDGSLAAPQKISLHEIGTGTLNTTYNTSSTITGLNGSSSYIVRISPEAGKDYVRNPTTFLADMITFVSDNFIVILALCFIVGAIAFGGRRR